VSKQKLAPAGSAKLKLKKKPRGKPFQKGHLIGAEFRFQPGASGNPSGRSSEQQRADAMISKALAQRLAEVGSRRRLKRSPGRTFTQKLADEWILQGLAGSWQAISALSNRLEGCPSATLISDGPNPLDLLLIGMTKQAADMGLPEGMEPVQDRLLETGLPEVNQSEQQEAT